MEEVVSESAVLSVNPLPSASFNVWEQGNGTFFFQNTSLHALALLWDFGDGQTASQLDPTHTYEFPGDYLVRLIATNGCGSDTASFTISYHPAPVAAFSATLSMGCAPLTVTFQNLTTGDSLWFEWIFEGGQPATSFETNPEVLYEQPDTFGVTLIAHSPYGSDTLYLAEAVVVHPLPTASFSFEIDSLTVRFTDLSEDAITWLWEFGDGQIATTPNPVHTYAQPGSYDVTLTVTNGPCGNAISTTILVMPSATSTARFPAVRLYPVPARHRLFIEAMEPGSLPLQAALYDVHGRAVRSFAIHASPVEVDVENVPAGLYLLRLCGRDGCMDARLIVE
ncbi:MAG: hypothetical protein KatS3mg029_0248 [Saprospiraceae bacterium]|nr:MAG: hypothetical protein KatS3mg029_0248 [Saprospiraceae bacterium]